MLREELEMRTLVRESDVIDRTDGSALAKAFNHLWEKYVEQETCDDAISRQAVLDKMKERDEEVSCLTTKDVRDLPTVKPQPKTGHWILADEQNKEDVENDNYRYICSECQCSDIHAKGTVVPYCWKCGAKMIEPQESEDKE
jgi:hypothetical protein